MHHYDDVTKASDHDLLVEIAVKMRDLAGNGKPGRMDRAEKRLMRLELWQAGVMAVLAVGAYMIHLLWGKS